MDKKSAKSLIGKIGEEKACEYLIKNGYKIIEKNYKQLYGEIDIICQSPEKTLVFVEVKTIQNNNSEDFLTPEDQLTKDKFKKISKTACFFVGENTRLINEKKGWRIDLLSLTIKEKDVVIKHYKNITT